MADIAEERAVGHNQRSYVVEDSAAVVYGVIPAERAVGHSQRCWGVVVDAPADLGNAGERAVGHGQRSKVRDAAPVTCAIGFELAVGHGQRSKVGDAAPVKEGGIAVERAVGHSQRSLVEDAGAIAEAVAVPALCDGEFIQVKLDSTEDRENVHGVATADGHVLTGSVDCRIRENRDGGRQRNCPTARERNRSSTADGAEQARFIATADHARSSCYRCVSHRESNQQRRKQNPRPPVMKQPIDIGACPFLHVLTPSTLSATSRCVPYLAGISILIGPLLWPYSGNGA